MPDPRDYTDAFVKVSFQQDNDGDPASKQWYELGSAKHQGTEITMAKVLQERYPDHTVVLAHDVLYSSITRFDLLSLPGVEAEPLSKADLIVNNSFRPLPRGVFAIPSTDDAVPAKLIPSVEYGGFKLTWKDKHFILYILRIPRGTVFFTQFFLLHEGPEEPSRQLLLTAGLYQNELHNEIWQFKDGFWEKSATLWKDIQAADWKDVILEADFKKTVKKDVYGFFESREMYKRFKLPWRRGVIMHGPPGNGKTISVKAIMKDCAAYGYTPLYVKTFKNFRGDEYAIQAIFDKARESSPSVIVLEDLDSHITDQNRSYFLNQIDGISGNDGILVLGTTNHFERLDPALSTRPSRFDRKFLFDDPDRPSRRLYVQYWQDQLADSDEITFPVSLAEEIADSTDKFSFAYLKEVFVSSLVTLMKEREEGHDASFTECVREEIATLRKQLDKPSKETEAVVEVQTMVVHEPLPAIPPLPEGFNPHHLSWFGSSGYD
ncbi:P-loop containing nucleoside triphosphate hydrolase protein [Peniophora sp. CONT]|nr:P-loop containing nucleoside triphosphate hydrolase protein [Peniophora sp. CONT]